MRIQQTIQINLATAGKSSVAQKLATIQAGDSVSAQVVGTDGGKLMIRMQDGGTLRADFKGQMLFLPGDQLELTLKDLKLDSGNKGVLSFRLSSVNGQPLRMEVSESESNLLRSGIEPTRQNMFSSRILQQNGYTPTPQNLENLSRIMQENPQMPEDVSSFFAANNIEPEEDVVQMLSQIQSEPSLLGNRADALASTLQQLFPSAVTDSAADTQPVSPQPALSEPQAGVPNSREFMASVLQLKQTNPQVAQRIANSPRFPALAEQLATLPPAKAESAINNFVATLALSPSQQKAAVAAFTTAYTQSAFNTAHTQTELNTANTRPAPQPEQKPGQALPSGQAATADTNIRQSAKASVSSQSTGEPGAQTLQTLFQKLSEFFATVRPSESEATAQSLQNTVRKQEKLAEDVESAVSSLAGDKHALAQQTAELRNQISLNSALENFYYYQIPVQYQEQKTTAELYVFERNRGAKETRDDCTILIALDTQNMGRCETLLRADGSGLDIRLKLSSQSACRLAQDNAGELRGSLTESGFQIKNLSFDILETKTTPLNAQSVFAGLSSYAPGSLNIQA